MSSEDDRAELISVAWALKTAIAKRPEAVPGVTYVHFNTLLRDESYREKILKLAAVSRDKEVRRLGKQALDLEISGSLIQKPGVSVPGHEDTSMDSVVSERNTPTSSPEDKMARRRSEGDEPQSRPAGGFGIKGWLALGALGAVAAGAILAGWQQVRNPAVQEVSGSILDANVVWRSETTYHLKGLVFVESGAALTIEPGTKIVGHSGSALIVTRDAKFSARGNKDNPVVFTSAQPVGQRKRGDWGGVVLLGNAPVNTGTGRIEGIDEADPRGSFGGNDALSSCGLLQYVRIEFAGFEISKDNELNGLTLGGCGEGTILSHVQVHMGLDDGIEFFGGSANLQYAVISRPGDDGLDWDRGWRGNGQFIVIQQGADDGDNGIEADNYKKDKNALPRSNPTLSNLTIVSSRSPEIAQRGMLLRRGTGVDLRNSIITGFTKEAFDLRDVETVALADTGDLNMDGIILADPPGNGVFFSKEQGESDDDGGFSEVHYFKRSSARNLMTRDRVLGQRAYAVDAPDFTPSADSEASVYFATIPQGEFWDEAANYAGAIRPGERVSWLDGWTAFPEN